jgi:hypothetical protein
MDEQRLLLRGTARLTFLTSRAREGFITLIDSNVASVVADADASSQGSPLCVRRGSQGSQNHNRALPTTPPPIDVKF